MEYLKILKYWEYSNNKALNKCDSQMFYNDKQKYMDILFLFKYFLLLQ